MSFALTSAESKNPVRNPFAQGAQVMATPSNNRRKDVYGGLPHFREQGIASLPEIEKNSPSSVSCVPSSSRKARQSPFLAPDSTRKAGNPALPIAETPTRGPSKLWESPPISTVAIESVAEKFQPPPLLAAPRSPKASNGLSTSTRWPLQIHETPSKFRYPYQVEQSEDATINATPVKAQPAASKSTDRSPKAVLPPFSQGKESIYAALGWEDEIDELL